jgi:signal peptidase I
VCNGKSPAPATTSILQFHPGQIFLLGDNRDLSTDSRQFGTVPLSDLVGNARQIWFSYGEGGVRWGRLGKVLE